MKKRMLSLFLALALLCSLLPVGTVSVNASSETDIAYPVEGGNIYFDKETGTITDCDSSVTSADIPAEIDGVAVTTIGDSAFYCRSTLTSVTIPDSITSVGFWAFRECDNLTNLIMGNNVKSIGAGAFLFCSKLTSVVIPQSVTSIGASAFSYCSSLTSVTIPTSVTSINDYAFSYCDSLANVYYFGSEDMWSAIAIGDYNDALLNATIHFFNDPSDDPNEPSEPSEEPTEPFDGTIIVNMYDDYGDGWNSSAILIYEEDEQLEELTISEGDFATASLECESCKEYKFVWNTGSYDYECSFEILYNGEIVYSANDASEILDDEIFYILNTHNVKDGSCADCGKSEFEELPEPTEPEEEEVVIYPVEGGNIYFDKATGTITDCDSSVTSADIPAEIDGIAVTTIGDWAFSDCSSLTSVTIPDSVTRIGDDAFYSCDSLTSVTIGDSVTSIGNGAFSGCSSLTSVTIPDSVMSIGGWAFSGCSSLTSVMIPDSVMSIGDYAFYYCTSLTSVTIPDSVTTIGDDAFSYCTSLTSVTIPDSVTTIGNWAFSYCSSLTSVMIPDSVMSIGDYAFSDCSSLTSVTIPDSVTSIGDWAFEYCTSLTGIWVDEMNEAYSSDECGVLFNKDKSALIVCPGAYSGAYTVPDSVTSIGSHAFDNCYGLTSVTIPDSVTSIEDSAFYSCDSLTDVYYSGTEEKWSEISIGDYNEVLLDATFHFNEAEKYVIYPVEGGNIYFDKSTGTITDAQDSIISADIPAEIDGVAVTAIGWSAFEECYNMTSIAMPDSIMTIGPCAFAGCSSLTSVTIPSNVITICWNTFGECSSLKSVVIPNSVTSIGDEAFACCWSLISVTIGDGVISIGDAAFASCHSLTDVYYSGTEEKWSEISIGDDNEPLLNATIRFDYNPEDPTEPSEPSEEPSEPSEEPTEPSEEPSVPSEEPTEPSEEPSEPSEEPTEPSEEPSEPSAQPSEPSEEPTEPSEELTEPSEEPSEPSEEPSEPSEESTEPSEEPSEPSEEPTEPSEEPTEPSEEPTEPSEEPSEPSEEPSEPSEEPSEPSEEPSEPSEPEIPTENPFTDVKESDYFATPVLWAVGKNITNGMSATSFAPNANCTRGQIVTFLWRACGSPEPTKSDNPFTDVKADAYYYKAVLWAVENGITTGLSATTFGPNATCTRGQVATFLWRSQGEPAPASTNNPFSDVKTSDYYFKAVLWAVENNVTQGVGSGKFAPNASCTRGQIVTFLYRAIA